MNKVIYTVIIGKGINLREPEKVCKDWDYICFTDQADIESDTWKIEYYNGFPGLSNRRKSRTWKILSFGNYDISIYMDSRFRPIADLNNFVKENLGNGDIAVCNHKTRDCIYDEAEYLIDHKLCNRKKVLGQIKRYSKDSYPLNNGLWTPNVMIRRNNKTIKEFQEFWWEEYKKGCERDMISLAYTLWKFPELKLRIMQFRKIYNEWIKYDKV